MLRRAYLSAAGTVITAGIAGCGGIGGVNDPVDPGAEPPEFTSSSPEQVEETQVAEFNPPPEIQGSWPMFQYDPANTGFVPSITDRSQQLRELWRFEVEGDVLASPAIVDGTVYIGTWQTSGNAIVYAIRGTDGTEIWNFNTGDSYTWASPAVAEDTVVIGTGNQGFLFALDRSDGTERWKWTSSEVSSLSGSPAIMGNVVYVGGFAFDIMSGDLLWETELKIGRTPAFSKGTVFVDTGRYLLALDAQTGTEKWRTEVDGPDSFSSAPTVADGSVYIGSSDYTEDDPDEFNGKIYAFRAGTGDSRWVIEAEDQVTGPFAVVDDTVYCGTFNGDVLALSTETGDQRWRIKTFATVDSLIATNDRLYVGSQGIYVLNRIEGTKLWQMQPEQIGISISHLDNYIIAGVKQFFETDHGGVVAYVNL